MNIPTIETKRLRLRAFEGRDLEPHAEMYADDLFVCYLGGKTLTKEQAWENMAIILGHWSLLGYGIWAVERLGTGELIGRVGLLNLPGWPDVEICWALSPKFWRNVYATEGAKASIIWAFREAGIHRLISLIHPENQRSEAVAHRLGELENESLSKRSQPMCTKSSIQNTPDKRLAGSGGWMRRRWAWELSCCFQGWMAVPEDGIRSRLSAK